MLGGLDAQKNHFADAAKGFKNRRAPCPQKAPRNKAANQRLPPEEEKEKEKEGFT